MKLYVLPGACSLVPHVALEWAKADYQLQIMDRDAIKSEEYLKINPQGSVPAISDKDTVVTQNLAVQTYIDAVYPDAHIFGATATPAEKANVMRWLAFLNSDLHKGFGPLFGPQNFIDDEAAQETVRAKASQKVLNMLKLVDEQLSKQDYLAGQKSTADIYLYVILRWAKNLALPIENVKNFNAFITRVESDEGVTQALAQEGLEKIHSL
ncbi:glutathione binding-like protein [Otariodibacter oris]|uniref:Glutathione S-transferase n=1 Tax=Otariodibacter oris TaxID=1032623 RepID=A0A420XGP2_9PAST|nr:glutathione binding-like protein [Otariodibacter oris]QGM81135.1 glutathione S-transferase [Otariodibacter oris]RKR72688.1 glutathione S-transferase [Otariodibacter oris]